VIAPHGWPDLWGTAARVIAAEPSVFVRALTTALATRPPRPDPAWREAFIAADRKAWKIVDANLRRKAFSEGSATRDTVASLPRDSLLVVGNSMAVRHVDYFCPGALIDVGVLSQRGASGIDGLIAGAAGAAVASRRAVTLLLGDLSFLHDIGGLATARGLDTPLVIVVLHNDGGRISELSLAGATAGAAAALTVFPHGIADLGPAVRLYGHGFRRVATQRALRSALTAAHARAGCSVIQVDVPPHAMAEQYRALWAAVENAG
jgi:2-succinyl-5-enolpyruvyl-6-hydroxy-3-cyclohexene-1-carboxylate synthase